MRRRLPSAGESDEGPMSPPDLGTYLLSFYTGQNAVVADIPRIDHLHDSQRRCLQADGLHGRGPMLLVLK